MAQNSTFLLGCLSKAGSPVVALGGSKVLHMKAGNTRCGIVFSAYLLAACTGTVGTKASGDGSSNDGSGGNEGDQGGGGNLSSGGGNSSGSGPSAGGPCQISVPMRRLSEQQYRNAVRDVFQAQATLAADFAIPTIGSPASGFTTDPGYNAVDLGVARELNDSAISVPLSVVDKLPTLLPCATAPNDACAQTFIDTFGRRAYRRPLDSSEKATLLKAFKLGSGADAFKDGIAAVVATLLNSPQFLYQTEAGTPVSGSPGVVQLTGFEVASRLSLLLWDSIPDDALLDAAAAGILDTAQGVRAQVDRLLRDAKAKSTVVRFAREWIHMPTPTAGQKLDKAYTAELSSAMQSEFDKFVSDSFLGQGKSLKDFFTSADTYSNATLDTFIKANGGYTGRAGLLTQPAFLTGISSNSDTSPIRRSVFIRTKVTCESFPAPPNDALSVETGLPLPATATQRERSAARMRKPVCAGCHHLIDPLGFGFEAFDELGRYRTKNKNGSALDASGDFVDPASADLGGKFNSLPELGERLAKNTVVYECLSRQFFRFNYGRVDDDADSCSVKGVAAKFASSGLGLRDLITSVATADEFRFRKVQ